MDILFIKKTVSMYIQHIQNTQHTKSKITLLQWYYKQLQLGKFMEEIVKNNDLSFLMHDFEVKTGENSHFVIKSQNIKKILQDIYQNSEKTNIFWYLTEINAFKGISGIMRELINQDNTFKEFLKKTLGKEYFSFEQVIFFTRNILSHSSTTTIMIEENTISAQQEFLKKKKISKINFDFIYSKHITQRKGSKNYGVKIQLDFKKIKIKQSLFDTISIHQLYLLCELCFNLSEIFRAKYKLK